MRSYTNQQGDVITVSEEHLNTSIRVKKELQKASPSRKCAWRMHKLLMEKEGFYDSDSNESYRCLIKDYQKSIGELPEVAKHADMVADSKLESIKELVGEIRYEKRDNQHVLRQINKGTNQLIDFSLVLEEIGNAFRNFDFSQYNLQPYEPVEEKDSKMIIALSDMHIGALVDTDINKYNFEVAVDRLSQYASKIITEARRRGVNELYIVNLGDVVEHSTMRYGQGFSTEFAFSEQITRASDLIIKFITMLANAKLIVTYAGIAGNHDRITDKDKNIDGDHAVKAINHAIEIFVKYYKQDNVKYVQAKDYKHSLQLNGVNVLALHGDLDGKNDLHLLSKHSNIDGVNYDLAIMGHYHTVDITEVGLGKYISVSGSIKGADDYSLNKIRKVSAPSQSYYVIHKDGSYEINWVTLK